jgi:predicted DNA-binding transcriptional regulator AlpA
MIDTNTPGRTALSVAEFCMAHGLSRSSYYKFRRAGDGPDEMKLGARTLISVEAAEAWRRRMEEKTRAA